MEQIYTVKEVMNILKVSKNTIYRIIENGELKTFKAGSIRIRESALKEYIEAQENK